MIDASHESKKKDLLMAAFLKTIVPSLATKLPCNAHRTIDVAAGENIAAGDPCYLAADGTARRSNGTAAGAAARVDGWATIDCLAGSPVTLFHGVNLSYGPATAAPGTRLYVSATPGQLEDAATTGGTAPVAVVEYISNDGTPHAVIHAMKSTY
jgi:hypothetical protein